MGENSVRETAEEFTFEGQDGSDNLLETDDISPVFEPDGTDEIDSKRTNYEAVDYAVDPGKIDARSGNFLFTVGSPSSGKSTLQSYLIYRLWSHANVSFDYSNADGNDDHDVILNGWVQNFANGYLPKRNPQGILQEFNVQYGQPGRPTLAFNFIEISGEDIRSIVPTVEGNVPQLHPYLEQYLRLGGTRKRFLFISDATNNRVSTTGVTRALEEDVLFDHLIRYLLSDTGIKLKQLEILFVATKWDVVCNEYPSERAYFNANFPQTQSRVKNSRRIKAAYMPFSVGDVYHANLGDEQIPRVRSLDRRYVDILINWIFHSFTQRPLKGFPKTTATIWDKVRDWFR
ncbi:MAG: hypothetical protein O7F71_07000 [Gammaproteobacteria bacterium]|nr:hypothetical protein [Gammaproteobacteria bacterium]